MVLSRPSTPLAGPRRLRRAGRLLAALAVLAALLPGAAGAVAPPDAGRLQVLGARCDSAGFVRVVTHRSTRLVQQVTLEADAVVLKGPKGRVALIEIGTPPEKRDTRIPWSDVESLSLGRSRTMQGMMTGMLVGAAIGGGIVGVYGTDLAEEGDHAVAYFGVLVGLGCTALGTILGAGNPQWTSLYP